MANNKFYVYAYVRNKDSITEDTRKKMSERAMNMSNEHKEKLSIAAKKRPPMSDEIKRKISETKKNKNREISI